MTAQEKLDRHYMSRALALARRGKGRTSPNPCVGAVIVTGGSVAGTGTHRRAGERHAEVVALEAAGATACGGEMYVTLEPCVHTGRTPPCVPQLVQAGLRRVVLAMRDPDPRVTGRGVAGLIASGVAVVEGVLGEDARRLNEDYVKFKQTGMPFVTLKAALSLDGKTATRGGNSRWISGPVARRWAHRLRLYHDAVMVGVGTLLADDPSLSVRLPGERDVKQPARVVLDSLCRTPDSARCLKPPGGATWVLCSDRAPKERQELLERQGARVLVAPGTKEGLSLAHCLRVLAAEGITSVLIEGGGTVAASAVAAGVVDKVWFVIAPKLIGGAAALTPLEGEGVELMTQARALRDVRTRRLGSDVLIEGYV